MAWKNLKIMLLVDITFKNIYEFKVLLLVTSIFLNSFLQSDGKSKLNCIWNIKTPWLVMRPNLYVEDNSTGTLIGRTWLVLANSKQFSPFTNIFSFYQSNPLRWVLSRLTNAAQWRRKCIIVLMSTYCYVFSF